MIITALGCCIIVVVNRVDVVRAIVLVGRVECGDSKRPTEDSVSEFNCGESVSGVEEVGSDSHGDGVVRTKLIVLVFLAALEKVFVHSAAVDHLGVHNVLGVLRRIDGNIEAPFKVLLDEICPSGKGDFVASRLGNRVVLVFALGMEFCDPAKSAVEEPDDLNGGTITRST